jgi:energy-coupling factor transport system permease protein
MIRDITIGQYYPTHSIIHELDARTKITLVFAFIVSLFFGTHLLSYAIAALNLAFVIRLSKVPFKFMIKGLNSIMVLIIFTVIINIFMTPTGTILFEYKFIHITVEGLIAALAMAIRLIMLIIGSSLLTLTTSPIDLTDAIERLLKPFERIKIPAHEIAMMMTIALRFIPILLEETDKIMKAQMARGADFETGGLIKKAKSLVPLLVPLFISAFRRADDLAMAMEARCYRGGEGRTKMKQLQYRQADYITYAIIVVYLIGIFMLGQYFVGSKLLF